MEENDGRRYLPRFSKENFPKVLQVVDSIKAIAEKYNATPAQVCLAWLLAQGDDIIPIPGTTKIAVRLTWTRLAMPNYAMLTSGSIELAREPWRGEREAIS